jgi:ferredoxin
MRSAECTACLVCIAVCPAQDALQFALPPRVAATAPERWWNRTVSPRALALSIAFIFFTLVLVARLTGHWNMAVPRQVYLDLVPHA